jgi:hypothetical protein
VPKLKDKGLTQFCKKSVVFMHEAPSDACKDILVDRFCKEMKEKDEDGFVDWLQGYQLPKFKHWGTVTAVGGVTPNSNAIESIQKQGKRKEIFPHTKVSLEYALNHCLPKLLDYHGKRVGEYLCRDIHAQVPEGFEEGAQAWVLQHMPVPLEWVTKANDYISLAADRAANGGSPPYAYFDGKLFVRRTWCIDRPITTTQMRMLNSLLDDTAVLPRQTPAALGAAGWFASAARVGPVVVRDEALAACVDFETTKQLISSMWVVNPSPRHMQGEGADCPCQDYQTSATGCGHILLHYALTSPGEFDIPGMLAPVPKRRPGRPSKPGHCIHRSDKIC